MRLAMTAKVSTAGEVHVVPTYGIPTDRQLEVLRFIADGVMDGRMVTLRGICKLLGTTSTNGAHEHLRAMERKGLIARGARQRPRAIRLTEGGWDALGLRRCSKCQGRGRVR